MIGTALIWCTCHPLLALAINRRDPAPAHPPTRGDAVTEHRTIRQVIRFVGLIALLSAIGIAVLAYQAKDVPEALLAVATTSLGALTAMLVKTSGGDEQPQAVQVQQPEGEPVPVEPVDEGS